MSTPEIFSAGGVTSTPEASWCLEASSRMGRPTSPRPTTTTLRFSDIGDSVCGLTTDFFDAAGGVGMQRYQTQMPKQPNFSWTILELGLHRVASAWSGVVVPA